MLARVLTYGEVGLMQSDVHAHPTQQHSQESLPMPFEMNVLLCQRGTETVRTTEKRGKKGKKTEQEGIFGEKRHRRKILLTFS